MEVRGVFATVRDAGADLLPKAATPEDGFLLDKVGIFWPAVHSGVVASAGESGHFLHSFKVSVLLNAEFAEGGDPLDLGEFFKNLAHGGEGPREVEVGGIQPTHDLAGGF
jgi:hypothetical protein